MYEYVLLLGTLISEESQCELMEYGVRPAPADIAQQYLLNGLLDNIQVRNVEAITSPRFSEFPNTRLFKYSGSEWEYGSCNVQTIGFCNLPIINLLHRQNNLITSAKKWARDHENNKVLVVMYSMHTPFIKAAYEIKKIVKNATISMIVADLPQHMSNYTGLKALLKRYDYRKAQKYIKAVDKYILYTKYMADALNLKQEQWIVMEGLIDTDGICQKQELTTFDMENKICLYAGSLDPRYGIDVLIKAFEKSSVDAQLHIYGSFVDWEKISSHLGELKKTYYKGILSSKEIRQKMKEATLLLNPRPSTLELAKYSCPSKTFEYMASGTPVLMTKLPGLPEEYYPYLYFFESETEEGFINSIKRVLSLDLKELKRQGREAATFINNEKNAHKQVEKIISFCLQ